MANTSRLFLEARLNTELTQVRFGKLFGVSQPTVSAWEDGSRPCSKHEFEIAKKIKECPWDEDRRNMVNFLINEGDSATALLVAMGGEIPGKVK